MTMIEITKDFEKWARYKHGDVWKRMTLEKLLARCVEGVKYNHRESEALIAYLQAEVTESMKFIDVRCGRSMRCGTCRVWIISLLHKAVCRNGSSK